MRNARIQRDAEFISGWKNIANYLGKAVRTVQRYETELGLPVHRPPGKASVIATRTELDAWIAAGAIRETLARSQAVVHPLPVLTEFKSHIAELHRLRQQAQGLRTAVNGSVNLLRTNLQALTEQHYFVQSSWEGNTAAAVVSVDSKTKKARRPDALP